MLELSLNEALSLGHHYIATEHLPLGLVRENEGVAIRILIDFGPEQEPARSTAPGSRANQYSLDQAWFGGLGGVLNGLAREILRELERKPDTRDLLLALACGPDALAAQTLRELGVDPDRLPDAIKRLRAQRTRAEKQRAQRIEDVRQAKELAIESQKFRTAARMRDHERELTQQARADAVIAPEALAQIRRHLAISGHNNQPPPAPNQS